MSFYQTIGTDETLSSILGKAKCEYSDITEEAKVVEVLSVFKRKTRKRIYKTLDERIITFQKS